MKDDPYFINGKCTESIKCVSWMCQLRRNPVHWNAPFLDGCGNCSQKNCGSMKSPILDKHDYENGTFYRCENFEFREV